MIESIFTPEGLAALAGVLLSLAFAVVPSFKAWYEAKQPREKQLWMLGFMGITTTIIIGISCSPVAEYMSTTVSCTKDGIKLAIDTYLTTVISNVITYSATKYLPGTK